MKFRKRIKRLLLTTGLVLAFGVMATGCGKKEAIPVESTQVETVAETQDPYALGNKDIVIEETTISSETIELNESETVEVGEYKSGDKVYTFDRYGDLGKGVFDGIASQWVNRIIEDEPTLRETMNDVYGELPTKEELTLEILSMTRADKAQEGLSAPTPETNPSVNEVKQTPNKGDSPASTETKSEPKQEVKQETPPAPVPAETQPTPVPTETAPTQAPPQETPSPQNNGLIPGTNLPSTGDPVLDAELAEDEKHVTQQTGSGHYSDTYEDQGKGITWN